MGHFFVYLLMTSAMGAQPITPTPSPILDTEGDRVAEQGQMNLKLLANPGGSFILSSDFMDGQIVANPDGSYSAKRIVVALSQLEGDLDLRDDHAKNKYLEVKKYPNAELIDGVGKDGKFTAQLKVKNIQKPVTGTYKIKDDVLSGTFTVKISDFGIERPKFMSAFVEDTVEVFGTFPIGVSVKTNSVQKKGAK